MEFAYALLVLILAVFIAAFILLVVGTIYFDFSNSEIPLGVDQPVKLRIVHSILIGTAVLGKILEKLGLCSQLGFTRYMRRGKKLGEDPKLFMKDLQFGKVPVRIYQPRVPSAGRRRGVLYFHGGGWMFGSINAYETVCRYIARESESVVVSVEYRLAPEHTYPAQYEDCLTATTCFMKTAEDYGVDPARIIISGDSAGGNLAAAVCQTLFIKDIGKPSNSIYGTDFICFPDHRTDRTVRRTIMKKLDGLPKQHLFMHHEEPNNRNLVTQYDDHYNRHGYNPVLPPLRRWNGQKLAWLPEKSDFPIFEPPTNYGLFEQLMKKWTHQEAGVMNSVYTVSYEMPPVSAFAVRRRPVTNGHRSTPRWVVSSPQPPCKSGM
ncbi:arylacetamide deacetylase-like 3 isoform X2 [Caretta caretta]|uniref:arylacetamide deacetylase-like 3 isoform X2 n=1 Tax=Caretta caretta TaxID=8467 RepID=UPI003F4C0CBB